MGVVIQLSLESCGLDILGGGQSLGPQRGARLDDELIAGKFSLGTGRRLL